jgi:hypothetical protein
MRHFSSGIIPRAFLLGLAHTLPTSTPAVIAAESTPTTPLTYDHVMPAVTRLA